MYLKIFKNNAILRRIDNFSSPIGKEWQKERKTLS
jgi:hypothetical protein